jgi:hypothetical protein
MAISHQLILVAAFIVMFTGSADAWCKAGFKSCDYNHPNGCETCVATDVNNCGDCHIKCPKYPYTTPTCTNGKCGAKCDDGWKDCNANLKRDGCEVNVRSDANNCGTCGVKCGYGAKCVNGKCKSACKPGWSDCNKDGECEVDCGNDVNNCGECNKKCVQPKYYGGETVCRNGKCVEQCKKGMKYDSYKKCCV